ncbi:MAG: 5-oxoprolinase/urea amidolyase family protein [Acidimicrobiales bacterium]
MTPAPGGGPVVRFGDSALLVPVDSAPAAARVAAEVVRQAVPGVVDVVPALRSVLVVVEPALADPGDLAERLGALDPASLPAPAGRRHDVPTVFDGADLPEVADAVGARVEEVVETLAAATLVVATLGFSPGFAYLAGLPAPLDSLGRRATPRPTVPPGSVALAAGFAAVYPQATPGGWHLVGRSALTLFDPAAPPYARLAPGDTVRFVPRAPERAPAPARPGRRRAPWSVAPGAPVAFSVEEPGLLTLAQDRGRVGAAHLGVPVGGPADPTAHQLANRLVGNDPAATALEVTARGPTLLARSDLHVAVVGADPVLHLDGHEVGAGRVFPVRAGQRLAVGAVRAGLRAAVAVSGGLVVPAVMGSRATDTLSWTGPGPVRAGDELGLGSERHRAGLADHLVPGAPAGAPRSLRVVAGPHREWFGADALARLVERDYVVDEASDRVGLRLRALGVPADLGRRPGELESVGMVTGAVQVPPDANPVVLGPDHATLGGYPVLAVVIRADRGVLGQCRPGDRVRLEAVSMDEAERAGRSLDRWLGQAAVGRYPVLGA